MPGITGQLEVIRERIAEACAASGRAPGSAGLIAVSKTFPVDAIREAASAGQRVFGESRLQEAEPKVRGLPTDLEWHFIGRVQRNKVRKILPLFSHIHAVDSLALAHYMDGVASALRLMPNIFLQVDLAGEDSKGGFDPSVLSRDFRALLDLPNLRVIGLMAIPPASAEPEGSRQWFRMLRILRDELEKDFPGSLPSLSMGMSGDYHVAVEEGPTHVRVGSAIFGNSATRVEGEIG